MYVSSREHLISAIASATMIALLGWALLSGLSVAPMRSAVEQALVSLALNPPPPPRQVPKPPPPPHERPRAAKGDPSPRNLRNKATQVVAPVLPPIKPPPVVAAPQAGIGATSNNGASDVAGPGQGAGGNGDGLGGGGDGGDGDFTPPRQVGGRLSYADLPADMRAGGRGGRVGVRYSVGTNGRVSDCEVTRSSGSTELDGATCRLIEQRFRFKPSRDANGRAVDADVVENHTWTVDRSGYDRPDDK